MPVAITKYVAADGSEWRDLSQAYAREREFEQVNAIMRVIPRIEVRCATFYQHDRETLFDVRRKMFEMACNMVRESIPDLALSNPDEIHPMAMCHVLDGHHGPITQAWNRLCQFNFENCRQYEQAFFAMNPDKATEEMK